MEDPTILGIMVAIGVVVFFFGLRRVMLSGLDVENRLGQYDMPELRGARESRRGSMLGGVDKAIEGSSFADNLARDLARANVKLTVTEFLMIQVGLGSFLLIVSWVAGAPFPIPFLLPLLALIVPRWYLGHLQRKRLAAFNAQLGDTLTMLSNALRSGYSLLQSMEIVSRDAPEPTGEEFQRVVREVGLGLGNEEALANLVRRLKSDDFDLVVTAINVQHEVGGNLAQILDTIGHTIRERVRIKGEIKVLCAQQQLSGYVISFMPIGLMGILFFLNPTYMSGLFTPGPTLIMPICGAIGIVSGFFAMKKITDIEI